MNGENYYFLTGISGIIYKIYRLLSALFMISQNSRNNRWQQESSWVDEFIENPEYQDFISDNNGSVNNGNLWNKHL